MQAEEVLQRIGSAMRDPRLRSADVAVYYAILINTKGNSARPSRRRISNTCGVHFESVRRSVARLVEFDYITVSVVRGRDTNTYRILAHQMEHPCSIRQNTHATAEREHRCSVIKSKSKSQKQSPAAEVESLPPHAPHRTVQ